MTNSMSQSHSRLRDHRQRIARANCGGTGARGSDVRRHPGGIPPCPGVGLYLTCKSDRLTVEANGTFFLILPLFEVINLQSLLSPT